MDDKVKLQGGVVMLAASGRGGLIRQRVGKQSKCTVLDRKIFHFFNSFPTQ